jgi:ATP-dependent Lhr-like helicase
VIEAPPSRASKTWTRDEAIVDLLRGRLTIVGPTTARALADSLGIDEAEADAALLSLESEGVAMRGSFSPRDAERPEFAERAGQRFSADSAVSANSARNRESTEHNRGRDSVDATHADIDSRPRTESTEHNRGRDSVDATHADIDSRPRTELRTEWCDRRLLARIHRYTLNRLRAEIEPVSPADFMRYLFAWQHVDPATRLTGIDGLRAIVDALDGFELAADAWERHVLPARVDAYEPSLLDTVSLTGEVGWARLSSTREATQLVGATPVALFLREHADAWALFREPDEMAPIGETARGVLDALRARGASFIPELVTACSLNEAETRTAIGELVAAGLIASDGFGGLRTIVRAASGRPLAAGARANVTGRWSLVARAGNTDERSADRNAAVETQARTLLRRYGIVFRKLLVREANVAPWRELARVYRRLEARGEVRGGRFVGGMSGEQFALPEAVERLREIRRTAPDGRLHLISGADPLNLAGIVTAGERVRAVAATRVVYRDGIPLAAMEGDYVRPLIETDVAPALASDVASLLAGRPMPPVISGFVGRS